EQDQPNGQDADRVDAPSRGLAGRRHPARGRRRGPFGDRGHDPVLLPPATALDRSQRPAHPCTAIGVIGKPIPTIGPAGAPAPRGPGPTRISVMPVVSAYLAYRPGHGGLLAAGAARVAIIHVFAGLKHPVAGAPPAVGRPSVIGRPRTFKPHAKLPDAAAGLGAEEVADEADVGVREAAHRGRVAGSAVPGVVVLRVDGEPAAGDQIVPDPDVERALEGIPDRNGAIGAGGHLVRVVLDEAEAGALGLVTVLVAVGGRGGKAVEVAVLDHEMI